MNTIRFSLNDVKRIAQCTRSNINYWRKLNLLQPEYSDNGKTKKVFSEKDVFFIRLISILNNFGMFSIATKVIPYLDSVMQGYKSKDYLKSLSQDTWCLVLKKERINRDTEMCYLWHPVKKISTAPVKFCGKGSDCPEEIHIAGLLGDLQVIINISNIAYDIVSLSESHDVDKEDSNGSRSKDKQSK